MLIYLEKGNKVLGIVFFWIVMHVPYYVSVWEEKLFDFSRMH